MKYSSIFLGSLIKLSKFWHWSCKFWYRQTFRFPCFHKTLFESSSNHAREKMIIMFYTNLLNSSLSAAVIKLKYKEDKPNTKRFFLKLFCW